MVINIGQCEPEIVYCNLFPSILGMLFGIIGLIKIAFKKIIKK